jgi:hypothetical protein
VSSAKSVVPAKAGVQQAGPAGFDAGDLAGMGAMVGLRKIRLPSAWTQYRLVGIKAA